MGVSVDYRNKVNVSDLDTIYITGAGFIRRAFKGVSRDSAWGWEAPVWGGDLTRSRDFILTNIEDVDYGLVARCEISYKYMNIQDYMDLMKISKERVVMVDFFNRETGQREEREMSFTGNELGKLYTFGTDYLGTADIKIKLVATNREKADTIKTQHSVSFYPNDGTITDNGSVVTSLARTVKWSNNTILLDEEYNYNEGGVAHTGTVTRTGYHLKYWATKDQNGNFDRYYEPAQHITVWTNLPLYAIWEAD